MQYGKIFFWICWHVSQHWHSPNQRVQCSFHTYQRCTFVSQISCGVRKWDLSRPQGKVRPKGNTSHDPRCYRFVPPSEMKIIGKSSRDLRLLDNVLWDEIFKTDRMASVQICKREYTYIRGEDGWHRRKREKERKKDVSFSQPGWGSIQSRGHRHFHLPPLPDDDCSR